MTIYVVVRKSTHYCSMDDSPDVSFECLGARLTQKEAQELVSQLTTQHNKWSMRHDEYDICEVELNQD